MFFAKRALLPAALALLLAPRCLLAQDADPPPDYGEESGEGEDALEDMGEGFDSSFTDEQVRALHGKMDIDGDGKLSFEETMTLIKIIEHAQAIKEAGMILESLDTSKDGKLSLEEHLAEFQDVAPVDEDMAPEARKKAEAAKFESADRNKDGLLDKDEFAVWSPQVHEETFAVWSKHQFQMKDKDSDGKLSVAEMWNAGGRPDNKIHEEEIEDFKKMESNGDGHLDMHEFKDYKSGVFNSKTTVQSMFEVADADKDGFLTADEMVNSNKQLFESDAQFHLREWATHHGVRSEEL